MISIESDRLQLRPFTENDAPAASHNSKQPQMAHFLSDMVLETEGDARRWIDWINREKFNLTLPHVVLAVVLKETGCCIGLIGVAPKLALENEIEIVFGIADEHQNKGYTTEAGHALLLWVFSNTQLQTLVAIAEHDNWPSNRVIEKLGFAYSGEKTISHNGVMTDFHYYRMERLQAIEKMDDFFTERVDSYDEHMLTNVPGCKEGYVRMAELIPAHAQDLLDLGCGTGLELDEIFKRFPNLGVTGIDLTAAMLEKLRQKHPDKTLNLICNSYFDVDFGENQFDCAVSFQTMHHFSHADKIGLYERIRKALKTGGVYIECDYMVQHQTEEDFYYAENRRLREELGISEGEFYHYDTPCTVKNQLRMFQTAGFDSSAVVWREENTTIIVSKK